MMTTGLKDVTGDVLYQGHRVVVVLWTRFCLIRYSQLVPFLLICAYNVNYCSLVLHCQINLVTVVIKRLAF